MRTLEKAGVISEEDKALLRQLKAAIRRHLADAEILLYGSVARGRAGPESDYDVLILTEQPLAWAQEEAVRSAVYELELEHDVIASMIFTSKAGWERPWVRGSPFRKEVDRDAIVL